MNRPAPTMLVELRAMRLFARLTLMATSGYCRKPRFILWSRCWISTRTCERHTVSALSDWAANGGSEYRLSGELQRLRQIPDSRRTCTLLDNRADRFGLVCDQVETLAEAPRLLELPACMKLPDSPIQALALIDGELGCVTTTEHLAALLAALTESGGGH